MEPRSDVLAGAAGLIGLSPALSLPAWLIRNLIDYRRRSRVARVQALVQTGIPERLAIRQRARSIAARYRGQFAEYDLNNEMIHGNWFEQRLGPEITRDMARWVEESDPDAVLFFNDYDILTGRRLEE